MSLASALLKYHFIHRTAKIPWSQVKLGKTPKPHLRPFWCAPTDWSAKGFNGLEFNVSHQAGMVVLMGCKTPNKPRDARVNDQSEINIRSPAVINPDPNAITEWESEIDEDEGDDVRIGVDIACTWEPPRTQDLSTQAKLAEWVEIFSEMFSDKEQEEMKNTEVSGDGMYVGLTQKARRFYTCWALKEAYIKMVGEGLLEPWLRQLEFHNVPVPTRADHGAVWTRIANAATAGLEVSFNGRKITKTMTTRLEGFEQTFIVASMTRGVNEPHITEWKKLDFGDIKPCATGVCQCLG